MRSSNGIFIGFVKLFKNFYAVEKYSKVAKMFRTVFAHMEGQNDSLEVFLPGRALGFFPRFTTMYNEQTKVGPKKATGFQKGEVKCSFMDWTAQSVCKYMKFRCRLWIPLW